MTARTDPGWVPLYPLCSGLVIERGRYVCMYICTNEVSVEYAMQTCDNLYLFGGRGEQIHSQLNMGYQACDYVLLFGGGGKCS